MAKPPGFEEWIKIANETGKTREERERLRADVYRRYGMKPPSDRGGIAGIWDRNKAFIKPIAQATAAYFGGPMAGAGVGAAMGGLDRPGKSGVGVDVGGAVRGGIQGYGVGQLASQIPGSAAKQAAAQAAIAPPVPAASTEPVYSSGFASAGRQAGEIGYTPSSMTGAPAAPAPVAGTAPRLANVIPSTSIASDTMQQTSQANPTILQSLLAALQKPEVLGGALEAGGQVLGGYMNRQAMLEDTRLKREQMRLEQERANRLAQLLMPMAQAQGQMVGAQYGRMG